MPGRSTVPSGRAWPSSRAVAAGRNAAAGIILLHMNLRYAISLWNYNHYVYMPALERSVEQIKRFGFGVEVWYDPSIPEALARALSNTTLSVHATGSWMTDWIAQSGSTKHDAYRKLIDDCAAWGCRTIVLHAAHIARQEVLADPIVGELDVDLAEFVVRYSKRNGIAVALENTLEAQNKSFEFEADAISRVDDLMICLDTGHVYWSHHSMADYLSALKHRIVHLHVQDIANAAEHAVTPIYGLDHLQPGSGGIPAAEWRLLLDTLEEIDFNGIAVFEVRPRHPLQLGILARNYMESFFENGHEI